MALNRVIHIVAEIWGAVFCLVVYIIMRVGADTSSKREKLLRRAILLNVMTLATDAAAYFFQGNPEGILGPLCRWNMALFFLSEYSVVFCMNVFFYESFREAGAQPVKIYRNVGIFFSVLNMFLIILSQFYPIVYYIDEQNYYHRMTGFFVALLFFAIGMFMDLAYVVRYWKYVGNLEHSSMLTLILVPFVCIAIQVRFYGASLVNLGITVALLFLFMTCLITRLNNLADEARKTAELKMKLAEQKEELADTRIKVLISQIQPHFLYNSLLTIRSLVELEAEDALETLDHFIGFLRGSIDMLGVPGPIHVKEEMEFVKNYLYLEKKRFGKKLQIHYQLEDVDFMLPPLSIEPLVENAVKHGIRKTTNGKGNLWIRLLRQGDYHVIEIEDDGVGFDVNALREDSPRVGVKYVREHIRHMCKGEMRVESEAGKGTRITLVFPINGGKWDENSTD